MKRRSESSYKSQCRPRSLLPESRFRRPLLVGACGLMQGVSARRLRANVPDDVADFRDNLELGTDLAAANANAQIKTLAEALGYAGGWETANAQAYTDWKGNIPTESGSKLEKWHKELKKAKYDPTIQVLTLQEKQDLDAKAAALQETIVDISTTDLGTFEGSLDAAVNSLKTDSKIDQPTKTMYDTEIKIDAPKKALFAKTVHESLQKFTKEQCADGALASGLRLVEKFRQAAPPTSPGDAAALLNDNTALRSENQNLKAERDGLKSEKDSLEADKTTLQADNARLTAAAQQNTAGSSLTTPGTCEGFYQASNELFFSVFPRFLLFSSSF